MLSRHEFSGIGPTKALPSLLIVDDDLIILNSMKSMVKKVLNKLNLEMQILEGSTGFELIDMVNDDVDNKIKIIFTDENMPVCEGSDAIRMISDIKKQNNIKIVSITAVEDLNYIIKILKSGADEVLPKPIHIKTIERIIMNSMLE
jgi:DNA-binding NarL/FixJ family response regulator